MRIAVVLAAIGASTTARAEETPCVVRAELRGIVNTGTASYLEDAIENARDLRCDALLLVLDTPGGDLGATRRIVRSFLGAQVPIVVYVSPSGARAGSAGMFVTMSAHVAAMTPGTTIGAAHPVLGSGQDPDEAGEELARKVLSDVSALARAIATERGRNAEWAELAVRESRSATATEALELRVVDRIARSERELLAALDGARVEAGDRAFALRTRGAELRPFEMSPRQKLLAVLGDPNLAYLLLMIGLIGVFIELSSPGVGVAGFVGAGALLLAAIGLDVLPVNLGAVTLLVLGAALLVAEIYVTSYGALLAAGVASIVAGSVLLVDPRDVSFFADASVRVSWGAVLPMVIATAVLAVALVSYVRRTRRRASPTGVEGLIGARAETLSRVGPGGGRVHALGESWAARSDAPIEAGREVRVRGVRGLELEVEPKPEGETR